MTRVWAEVRSNLLRLLKLSKLGLLAYSLVRTTLNPFVHYLWKILRLETLALRLRLELQWNNNFATPVEQYAQSRLRNITGVHPALWSVIARDVKDMGRRLGKYICLSISGSSVHRDRVLYFGEQWIGRCIVRFYHSTWSHTKTLWHDMIIKTGKCTLCPTDIVALIPSLCKIEVLG